MEKRALRIRLSGRLIAAGAFGSILLIVIVLFSMIGVDELVDIWWFDALGYPFYYWQRLLYRYLVFGGVSLVFFLIFFMNFWIAARYLRHTPDADKVIGKTNYGKINKAFQTGSLLFYVPLSLILTFPLAMPLYQHWEKFLFYIFGRSAGVQDPFFGKDVAFYLFSFPIYSLVQQRLLLAVLVLLAGLVLLYMVKNRLLTRKLFHFSGFARWHLSLVVLAAVAVEIWDLLLQRYGLVFDTTHQPLFTGPGFVQMKVIVPLIWVSLVLLVATAGTLLFALQFRRGYKVLAGLVVVTILAFTVRHADLIPQAFQTYLVKPNAIEKESRFIEKNVQATLNAYDLNRIEVRKFQHERFPEVTAPTHMENVLRNIPVWDANTLSAVFQQLQELRTYYAFPQVSVDRYDVTDNRQQVFLSLRELEYGNLPGEADNWINRHLVYTHGYGLVMTPASQESGTTMTWFVHNIPPESRYGIEVKQPRIYYGLGRYPYTIAPNKVGEMDYPKGNSNVTTDYDGDGGMPISSLFRRFVFFSYFGEKNILFSGKINKESKLLMRRQILERINYLAPYLSLDQMPYGVVTPRGMFWIVDAYTTSDWYPAAASYTADGSSINYLRNSVKIVVDAYNGSVDFYAYDERDPIIKAYQRIYPGLFKDKADFPEDLKPHVRYPKDLFEIQMRLYAKYHQTNPRVYFQQEDIWTFAQELEEETTVPRRPYFITTDMIEPGKLDFMLLLPMFPKGKDNLRAMAVAGCDEKNYGKIIVYDFPKGELIYGPAQIDALINQDPNIAQQFTLWDQAGSSVVRGKMIILPVKNSVLFIQPVYLKSTSRVNIPELQRIIMSEGRVAVMATSLEEAFAELQQRVGKELQNLKQRFPTVPEDERAPDAPLEEEHSRPPATNDSEQEEQPSPETPPNEQRPAPGGGFVFT